MVFGAPRDTVFVYTVGVRITVRGEGGGGLKVEGGGNAASGRVGCGAPPPFPCLTRSAVGCPCFLTVGPTPLICIRLLASSSTCSRLCVLPISWTICQGCGLKALCVCVCVCVCVYIYIYIYIHIYIYIIYIYIYCKLSKYGLEMIRYKKEPATSY